MLNLLKKISIVTLACLLFLQGQGMVYGKTLEELEAELDAFIAMEEANEEAQELNEQQQALAKQIKEELDQALALLELDILTLDGEIADLRIKEAEKEVEIATIEEQLYYAKEEEAAYHDQVSERMKIMYEYGEVGFLQILFESEDLSDFFTRLEYITKIFNYDEKMFDKLDEMQRVIQADEASLEVSGLELDAIIEDTESKLNEVTILYEEKGSFKDKIEEAQGILELKEQELAEADALLDENIKLAQQAYDDAKLKWRDGVLDWPAPGYGRITSDFGWRIHPIKGTKRFHSGIDIAVPYGGEIVAADHGIVTASYYSSSYGNVVVIYHGTNDGSSYSTLYAHNSKLLVEEGESVTRGQLIAYAGSTGWSTGPHLHFSVKKDDDWVNPIDYFNMN